MNNLPSIFNQQFFDHWTVGFDRVFDQMQRLHVNVDTFPPYNIKKVDSEHYQIEIAVAGMSKKDVAVDVEKNVLTVKAETSDKKQDYLHKGIATRKFIRRWQLADYVEVTDAKIEDGILRVDLKYDPPADQKKKTIEIN
tara:strand:+ start:55 stop:471 length:417 start_codon:yes stop_codon:yes gene_type:complete